MRSVAITGIGCVTGFGAGVELTWRSLLNARVAAHPLLESGAIGQRTQLTTQSPPAAELTKDAPGLGFPPPPRTSLLALLAAREAWRMARLPDELNRDRAGLMVNRNFGQHAMVESYQCTLWDKGPGAVSGLQFVQTIANAVLGRLALDLKLRGPSNLFFGPPALGPALDIIRDGQADVVLAGGLDEISDIVLALCDSHGLTPASASMPEESRPYDVARAGLIPGDGAAFFVLEDPAHAESRGAEPLGYLRGYASVTDRESMSNPARRDRYDVAESIRRALADADIAPEEIAFVSGAGAGLRHFDEVEMQAVADTLPHLPPVTSVKGAVGETWGAAGGLSLMAAVLSLRNGMLPPTAGLKDIDPACPGRVVMNSSVAVSGQAALSMSFDMTGQDSAFVLTRKP